jgi:hypothetical protein
MPNSIPSLALEEAPLRDRTVTHHLCKPSLTRLPRVDHAETMAAEQGVAEIQDEISWEAAK